MRLCYFWMCLMVPCSYTPRTAPSSGNTAPLPSTQLYTSTTSSPSVAINGSFLLCSRLSANIWIIFIQYHLAMFFSCFYDAYSVLCCCCSLLKTYADYESNPLLRRGIEFCCRQFYILHRKPFILQLFASVAPLLEFTVRTLSFNDQLFIHRRCYYSVITALLNIAFFFLTDSY